MFPGFDWATTPIRENITASLDDIEIVKTHKKTLLMTRILPLDWAIHVSELLQTNMQTLLCNATPISLRMDLTATFII